MLPMLSPLISFSKEKTIQFIFLRKCILTEDLLIRNTKSEVFLSASPALKHYMMSRLKTPQTFTIITMATCLLAYNMPAELCGGVPSKIGL
jgi:hypothetical protein